MHRKFLIVASILGAVAVVLGAFGAHGLKAIAPPESVAAFHTGVEYQFYHVFALFMAGMLYDRGSKRWIHWSGFCFLLGILLFSGSLYTMTALRVSGKVGLEGLGIVTPFGGLFFIAGWLLLAVGLARPSRNTGGSV